MVERGSTPTTVEHGLRYVPALDAIRGIAVLLVILRHLGVGPLKGGGPVGVGIFFALSGYLITTLLLLEHERLGRMNLRRFYVRRAARLLPALLALLVVVTVAGILRDATGALREAFFSLVYLGNWAQVWGPRFPHIPHTWSLAVEEHFYLAWPLVLVFVLPRLPRSRALWIAGATVVAGLVLRTALLVSGAAATRVHYGSDTRADAILVGAFVALWLGGRTRRVPALAAVGSWVVLALLVLVPPDGRFMLTAGYALTAVAGAVVVVDAARPDSGAARVLNQPALVWVGGISYGLYLWHLPIILWLGPRLLGHGVPRVAAAALALLLAVGVAAASGRWLERPILRRVRAKPRGQHAMALQPKPVRP